MPDYVFNVGYATGTALADILNRRQNNEPDPKEIVVKTGPDLSQIEKDKDKPNLGKLFPDPDEGVDPDHQVNPETIAISVAEGVIGTVPVFDERKLRDRGGMQLGEEIIFTIGGEPSEENLDPAKGLGGASAVDQINQDLHFAQAAPAVQAGAGIASQSGAGGLSAFGAGVLQFLSVPFSSIMIWLAGTQDVADATLDNIPPEQLAQIQARMAHAAGHDDTLGGRLVFEQGADGFLRASDAETGEVVVGPDGQILSPELLTALTLGYLGQAEWGDPIPGVTRLPSNIFTVGQSDPMTTALNQAREINRQGNLGDLLVVVDVVLRNGESAQGFIRGGFDHLVEELVNLAGIGMLPENTSVDEILRRSGIESTGQLTELLTSIATSGISPEAFVSQIAEISQALQSAVNVERPDDGALPPITIDIEAEEVPGSWEVERPGPGDQPPQVAPDQRPPFDGHFRITP